MDKNEAEIIRNDIAELRGCITKKFVDQARELGQISQHLISLNTFNKSCEKRHAGQDERIRTSEKHIMEIETRFVGCREEHKGISETTEKRNTKLVTILALIVSVIMTLFVISNIIYNWIH